MQQTAFCLRRTVVRSPSVFSQCSRHRSRTLVSFSSAVSTSALAPRAASRGRRTLSTAAATRRAVDVESRSPAPGSTQQQWQQQQQDAIIPQQQYSSSTTTTSTTSSTSMTGAASSVPSAGQQAAAAQPRSSKQLQPAGAGAGPSLDHPSTIPLSVEGDVVRDAAGNVVLDRLHPNMTLNPAVSKHGALVFGARTEQGAADAWDLTVGRLKFTRYLACARNKLWWMTPEWGTSLHTLPPETQFLLLQLEDEQQHQTAGGGSGSSSESGSGRYAVVLPLIDGHLRATCRPNRSWTDRDSSLCMRVESGDENTKSEACESALLLACGSDPFQLVDAGVAAAAALSGGAAPRSIKQLPASLDGFGWCTWDAFYSTVSARGLVEGLSSLHAGGIAPRLLIIDDGWQLTDVDPPYGKAPTAQLAEKLPETGRAGEVFENTREMLLETQDTYYEQSAKLLAEASGQMQQEVRNLFPTVANTGVISHHHAPPAASWDAAADAVSAAKEAELEVRRSRDAGAGADVAGADGGGGDGAAAAGGKGSRYRGSRSSRLAKQEREQQRQRQAAELSVVMDDEVESMPDWAEERIEKHSRHPRGSNRGPSSSSEQQQALLTKQQQERSSSAWSNADKDGDASSSSSGNEELFSKYGVNLASLADKYGVSLSALEDAVRDPKRAAAAAEEKLRAAVHEAEERLKAAIEEAEDAIVDALVKAGPTPRQQFILIRWAQKAAGALVGIGTAAFLLFYQWVIEPAAPNSLRVKAWARLTNGLLRGAMLSFFASASDFTRRLTSVEANAKFSRLDAGPEEDWEGTAADLRGVVTHIKQRFGVNHVYCWHGLPAYWGGIMPSAPGLGPAGQGGKLVYPKPTSSIAEVEPSLLWSPAVLAGVGVSDDPGALYNSMHAYLASSAVDGVKVDCQAGAGLVGSCLGSGAAAAERFQAALEDSIARHFPGNHAINCMCHSSENFYRFSRTAVARVSDDYYPRDPASSTPHIGACAFNSLYLGAIVQPDWDMFQSAHPAGMLHGMARAVSGGAVYVSDKPGQHDFTLLRRLVLPDGYILRAQLPGRPTRDCLFHDVLRDNRTMLKVWNINPVVGIVGVFNLQGSSWDRDRRKFHIHSKQGVELATHVCPDDIEPFRSSSASQSSSVPGAAAASDDGSSSRWAGAAAAAGVDAAAGSEAAASGNGSAGSSSEQQQQQRRQFAVYRYGTEELRVCSGTEGVDVKLPKAASDLVWVSPLQQAAGISFAPLGLVEMFNGGGAVLSYNMLPGHQRAASSAATTTTTSSEAAAAVVPPGGPKAVAGMQVRGCGRFLAYSSVKPRAVLLNLTPHNFSWDEYTCRLEFEVPQHSEDLMCEVEVLFE